MKHWDGSLRRRWIWTCCLIFLDWLISGLISSHKMLFKAWCLAMEFLESKKSITRSVTWFKITLSYHFNKQISLSKAKEKNKLCKKKSPRPTSWVTTKNKLRPTLRIMCISRLCGWRSVIYLLRLKYLIIMLAFWSGISFIFLEHSVMRTKTILFMGSSTLQKLRFRSFFNTDRK